MIMPEVMEIYHRAMPNGKHTREQIKAWAEFCLTIDSFSPRRLEQLLFDTDYGIDSYRLWDEGFIRRQNGNRA